MPTNELISSWLLKASHDLDTAKIVAAQLPDFYDVIAFHCQQTIEKSLKGYLVFLDVEFKPVHDLGYLLNLASTIDVSMDIYFKDVDKISRYAVQIRYPDTMIMLSKSQIEDAIQIADSLMKLVKEKIA